MSFLSCGALGSFTFLEGFAVAGAAAAAPLFGGMHFVRLLRWRQFKNHTDTCAARTSQLSLVIHAIVYLAKCLEQKIAHLSVHAIAADDPYLRYAAFTSTLKRW
jgi:hypothetical protein